MTVELFWLKPNCKLLVLKRWVFSEVLSKTLPNNATQCNSPVVSGKKLVGTWPCHNIKFNIHFMK